MRALTRLLTLSLLCLLLSATTPLPTHADYGMPTRASVLADTSAAAIDARVTTFDAQGHAVLDDVDVLAGASSATSLFDIAYTCFGGSLNTYGVQAKQRYVFLVLGDRMLEETSRFPVTLDDAGVPVVEVGPHYAEWLGLPGPIVTLDALRAHLAALWSSAAARRAATPPDAP